MGCARLSFAVAFCLAVAATPASAVGPRTLSALHIDDAVARAGPRIQAHFRKTQSFYCYPRNYWWFYRPYTTAIDGHARCMPYFHYLEPYGRRDARPGRYVK